MCFVAKRVLTNTLFPYDKFLEVKLTSFKRYTSVRLLIPVATPSFRNIAPVYILIDNV